VRRADDAVGQVLRALEGSGVAEDTLVMFLSDHGMPFPFAKTQLYHSSTWTPLIFRWPGVVSEGSVDDRHLVSAVDLLPTLLGVVGVQNLQGLDGRSFLSLLEGGTQEERDAVFKEYNENSSGDRNPMRAVQTSRFLYIFNPWSNGKRVMRSATLHTNTFKRMAELAAKDDELMQRLDMLRYREVEEFYDIQNDPDCLVNLISDPRYQKEIEQLQSELEVHMRVTNDPVLPIFIDRLDQDVLEAYMADQSAILRSRRQWTKAIREYQNKKAQGAIETPADTEKQAPPGKKIE
jgi:N-sulfoglucosamine sulfohydrolase